MTVHESLTKRGITQATLAKIISADGVVTDNIRVRAHRIWHGQKPADDEMLRIVEFTNGELSANIWFGIPDNFTEKSSKKVKKSKSN